MTTTMPIGYDGRGRVNYTFLADDLKAMQQCVAQGDVEGANASREVIAQDVVDTYGVSLEEAMEIVDQQYACISGGISYEDTISGAFQAHYYPSNEAYTSNLAYTPAYTPTTNATYTSGVNYSSGSSSSSSSNYKITDYTFMATNLAIMNDRLSGDNEHEALDMRKEMAANIVQMYANNGATISEAEALAMVDLQYSKVAGESLVDTIKETTKSADSFWNYVPIVNLFIDDTSSEDLYKYMEGKEANTKDLEKNGFAKVLSSTAAGAGAGAGVGACFAGVGAIPGAIIGGVIGLVTGIVDCFA